MNHSFYHYMMKYRNGHGTDELSLFAVALFHDHDFPKYSGDYDEISNYLELSSSYITSMTLFDDAWELYKLNS